MGWNPFEAIGDAVESVVDFVGDAVKGVIDVVGSIVTEVVDFVVQPFMSLFGMDQPQAPDEAQAKREEGVLIQQQGSNVSIPVVYGLRKIAGTVVFAETGANNNKYLWVAYVFAEGGVEGASEIYIDDTKLDDKYVSQLNSGSPVDITSGKYKNRLKLQAWGDGYRDKNSYTRDGNKSILSDSPSWDDRWTANGLVTVMARFEWKKIETQEDADNNPYNGQIPKVQITLFGRRVASLINPNTPNREYEGAGYTERYSTNPAEILLDYLRNPRYGKGLRNDEIDWPSWQTAAQKMNTEVVYVASGERGPIITCNTVIDTSKSLFNNTKQLLTGMRSYMPYVQGKYKLKVEDAGNPTDITSGSAVIQKVFNTDNIVGKVTYTGVERSAKYTEVTVKYVDPDNKWSVQEVVYPESEAERLELQQIDGGRVNKKDMTIGSLTNYAIARDFARLVLYKSRYQDTLSFKANSEGFDLEPGDNIYVSANILKFGTDPQAEGIPWRVVSIQLNNDYTFDIGCVRNPDFIYPYVTAGEIDTLVPTYIPRGAEIYYPGLGRTPIGLIPPTNSETDDQSGNDRTGNDGGTTDPTDPTDGGGVGDPDSTPNEKSNPPPEPEEPTVPVENDYVEIENAVYSQRNGSVYATLSISQPDTGVYDYTKVWYKRNTASETVWTLVEVKDKPGGGKTINFEIGPLLAGFPYAVKTRVIYSTGDASEYVNSATLNVEEQGNEDPQDYQQTVTEGWSLNTEPQELKRNTYFNSVSATPVLDGGFPSSPRTLRFTIVQEIYGLPINGYIKGLQVFTKVSSFDYWTEREVVFDDSYAEGAPYEFDIEGLGSPGSDQFYDFILRFSYTDGTHSTVQYRAMGARVETGPFGSNSFNPFYSVTAIASGREPIDDYNLETVDNAPPGAVTDARDLKLTFNRSEGMANISGRDQIIFWFNEPDDPQNIWRGVRIYYRKITYAGAQEREVADFLPVTTDVYGRLKAVLDIEYDIEYEYVVVPIVSDAGQRVEALQSWRGVGYINGGTINGRYPDWFQRLEFKRGNTDVLLSKPVDPVPEDTEPQPNLPTNVQILEFNLRKINTAGFRGNPENTFYEMKYYKDHITDFQSISVYRRVRSVYALNSAYTNDLWGYGPWEKLDITKTATDADGLVNVYLRVPLSHQNFTSRDYELTQDNNWKSLYYDYSTDTFTPRLASVDTVEQQFFVVTNNSAGSSPKGLFMLGNEEQVTGASLKREIVKNAMNKPQERDPADFNTLPTGFRRNLNEAYTAFAPGDVVLPSSRSPGYTPSFGEQ